MKKIIYLTLFCAFGGSVFADISLPVLLAGSEMTIKEDNFKDPLGSTAANQLSNGVVENSVLDKKSEIKGLVELPEVDASGVEAPKLVLDANDSISKPSVDVLNNGLDPYDTGTSAKADVKSSSENDFKIDVESDLKDKIETVEGEVNLQEEADKFEDPYAGTDNSSQPSSVAKKLSLSEEVKLNKSSENNSTTKQVDAEKENIPSPAVQEQTKAIESDSFDIEESEIISSREANEAFLKKDNSIKIAAGSLMSGYYNMGLRLCSFISKSNNNAKCRVIPTSGSIENIELLREGKVHFAFALSSIAVDAHEAKDKFEGKKKFSSLKQLLRLHEEIFTVITRDQNKILLFSDLKGKKISNGTPESDSSLIYDELMHLYKFDSAPEDIEVVHENYAKELCNGSIDAVMVMTGHPNSLVNLITNHCETDFVQIDTNKMDLLLKNHPGFHKVILESGAYPGITESQDTIASDAALLVSNNIDTKIVKRFMDYFNLRISRFKASDPSLYNLEDEHFSTGFVLPAFGTEENIEKNNNLNKE